MTWRERLRRGRGVAGRVPDVAEDVSPTMLVKETAHARRNGADDSYFWRINQFLMPAYALIPPAEPDTMVGPGEKYIRMGLEENIEPQEQTVCGSSLSSNKREGMNAMDVETLKKLDALLKNNAYDDATFEKILPHYQEYLEAREKLRALPLGEVQTAQVMLAGGQR